MARIRSIKPELASKKKLAQVSRDARYTLCLLISQADDEGFIPGEHRQLLGSLYPHDTDVTDAMLEVWLTELASTKTIVFRQTEDGARVVQLVNWHKHQRVKNPSPSKISPTLLPLSVHPPENLPPSSPLEVGSRKGEGGSRKEEEGRGKEEGAGAPDPASGPLAILRHFPEPYHDAVRGAIRAARNPGALVAELHAIEAGMHGPPRPWAVIGQALHEMAVKGSEVSAVVLRGFCRRIAEDKPPAPPNGTAASQPMAPWVKRLEDKLAAEGLAP